MPSPNLRQLTTRGLLSRSAKNSGAVLWRIADQAEWRKLHLAVDADNGTIVAQTLTDQDTDDPSQVGPCSLKLTSKSPG